MLYNLSSCFKSHMERLCCTQKEGLPSAKTALHVADDAFHTFTSGALQVGTKAPKSLMRVLAQAPSTHVSLLKHTPTGEHSWQTASTSR